MKKEFYITIIIFFIFFLNWHNIYAASLSLLPSSPVVSAGDIVSLKVVTSTDGKYINNSEATLQFPSDLLEVVSITKGSSIFTLWVEEPSFSNITGKITFNGGIPNPGYNGSNGNIATITFKAKKQGVASVFFTDGAVRANDGLGTDILVSKNGSVVQIGTPKEVTIPVTATEKSAVPIKPIVFSNTHPDQEVWYSETTASFNWEIPSGVTSVQTLLNKSLNSVPTIIYDNSVSQKTVNNIEDGVSYFHIRFINSAGASPTAHYRVKIDSTPPESFSPIIRIEDKRNIVKLNAVDLISGIDYYTLQIDDQATFDIKKEELENNEYILDIQNQGGHNLTVVAYDQAGNYTQSTIPFVSPTISAPELSLSSDEITNGETITISGKSDYPNNQVEVTLQSGEKYFKKYLQTTLSDGTFSIISDKIKVSGLVSIWAENIFSETVKSPISEKLFLKVNDTKVMKITLAIVYPLISLIIIILLLLILFFLLYLGWHKFFGLKRKINQKTREIVKNVHEEVVSLKEDLSEQLTFLEEAKKDRVLNEKEEKIFNQIKKNIDKIDNLIEKKLNKLN